MSLIAWSDGLCVGIKEIDEQHKQLVKIINRLHDAMKNKQGREVLGSVLDHLIDYTLSHFSMEERLMAIHGYPHSNAHIQEHKNLVNTVIDFQKDFNASKVCLTLDTMNFLKDWLNHHILQVDMHFGKALIASGVR